MKKFFDYIANAQGLGIRYLLLFSLIVGLFLAGFIRFAGTAYIPYAQQIADQILPLKIKDGKIIEPLNCIKQAGIDIKGNKIDLPVTINTTVDTLRPVNLTDGIYLTRTSVYTINGSQIRINKLSGTFELPRADYTTAFSSILTWIAVIGAVFGTVFIFFFLFILSIFYASCAYVLAAAMKKSFDFNLRMRSSVISLLGAYILLYTLAFIGISSGKLTFFLVVMIFEYILLKNIPSPKNDIPTTAIPPAGETKNK